MTGDSVLFHLDYNNNQPQDAANVKAIVYIMGHQGNLPGVVRIYYTDNTSWYMSEDDKTYHLSSLYEAYNPSFTFTDNGQWMIWASMVNFSNGSIGLSNTLNIHVGAESISFYGKCIRASDGLTFYGANVTVLDQYGNALGTSSSDLLGGNYLIELFNVPNSAIYTLKGNMSGYDDVVYTSLIYPDYFNGNQLQTDFYFYTSAVTPTPTPDAPSGVEMATITANERQAMITKSGDFWAAGLPAIIMIGFIGIIFAIFGRMGKG
jgi:hypothetical protein